MTYSLWDQAQGKEIWDYSDDWPKRCNSCGRRIPEPNDRVSVFIGEAHGGRLVVHEICSQHGGQHIDCLMGVEIDFGDSKNWPAIWAGNLLGELVYWLRTVVRFAWLVLTHSLRIVMHLRRYCRYKQRMRKWGME